MRQQEASSEATLHLMTASRILGQVAAASKLLDAGLQVTKVQELEKLLADLETRLQDE
jgi:hypothetical protein